MSDIYSPSQIPKKISNSRQISQYYSELVEIEKDDSNNFDQGGRENKFLTKNTLSPNMFIDKYGDAGVETIYEWYSNAMSRRNGLDGGPRVPLEYDRFVRHFFDNQNSGSSLMYGNIEDGFLLGSTFDNFFHVSHFAPKTLKGGYRLLKNLGEDSEISAMLTITADLIQTIKKMKSWNFSDTPLPIYNPSGEYKYLAWNNDYTVHQRLDNIVEYCIQNGFDLPPAIVETFLKEVFKIK
jgi:hypothetical protein